MRCCCVCHTFLYPIYLHIVSLLTMSTSKSSNIQDVASSRQFLWNDLEFGPPDGRTRGSRDFIFRTKRAVDRFKFKLAMPSFSILSVEDSSRLKTLRPLTMPCHAGALSMMIPVYIQCPHNDKGNCLTSSNLCRGN